MIKIGQKVKFYPFREYPTSLPPMDSQAMLNFEMFGKVADVYGDRNYFLVEYGPKRKQYICFNFCDIDVNVFLVEEA